jgi:predicted dehydrogenase
VADHPEGPIRVALIGYGLAGAVFHGPLVSSTPGLSLATIVTRDPERRARARSDHPDAQLLAGVDALWQRAANHDLVVVATPNRSHVPLGLAALESGLPVVIDKPMSPTAEDGRRLVAEATERDLLLAVFQNRRWDGDFLTVRRLLSEDALGPIVRFESRFERWRPRVRPEAWRERGDREEAGGLLFDLGSHLIDQAVVLFGPPRTVYAEVDRRRPSAEVDDDVFVALEHGAGVRSHLWMSVLAAIPGPRMRVLGMRAAYEKFGLDVQERELSEGAARPDDPDWGREPPDRWGRLSTADGERTVETEPGAYPEFYRGIAASLRDGTPPPVDPNDSVAVLEIIEAAQESARTQGVVVVG